MKQPEPAAEFRTSFIAALAPPAVRARIRAAARIADWWLALPPVRRRGPIWPRRWTTALRYPEWLVARDAAQRAIGRNWLVSRALEGLFEVMFPRWRRRHGMADVVLVPHKLAPYEWVIDAVLAELVDPETLTEELGGRISMEDALELLRGAWLAISASEEETE